MQKKESSARMLTSGSVNKYGRCWNCGSSQHRREDCPVRDSPQKPQVKKGKAASGDKKAEEVPVVEKVEETTSAQGSDGAPAGGGDKGSEAKDSQVAGLLAEATHLLRSMRPSLKAVKLSSLEKGENQRALLDGGATHALRMPRSQAEYDDAVPIRVELASGETVLRQVVETGTLLTDGPTQTIVPLGKLMVLGYAVD